MTKIEFGGHKLSLHPEGAVYWHEEGMLMVSDLHLSVGQGAGMRSRLFQPASNNHETIGRLENVLNDTGANRLLVIGDSFMSGGPVPEAEADMLEDICAVFQVIWVSGTQNSWIPSRARAAEVFSLSGITFRHRAAHEAVREISGYYHPTTSVPHQGAMAERRCFVEDGRRLIMPSFGDYSGGMDVCEQEISGHFRADFRMHVMGLDRVYSLPGRCLAA